MKVAEITRRCRTFRIEGVEGLDPVTVLIDNESLGRGLVVVECYGRSWSAFFGATGQTSMEMFLSRLDADYLASALTRGSRRRPTVSDSAYLDRIADAVIKAMRVPLS
jgi:hypothetical protein